MRAGSSDCSSRILLISQMPPWPTTKGAQQRLYNVAAALQKVGEVDLYSFSLMGRQSEVELRKAVADENNELAFKRLTCTLEPSRLKDSKTRLLLWLCQRKTPAELFFRNVSEVREHFNRWISGSYDLIWFSRAKTHRLLGNLVSGPTIVDFDDLEHEKLALLQHLSEEKKRDDRLREYLREVRAIPQNHNIRCWRNLYRDIGKKVYAVTVCSEEDRALTHLPNVVVIPNGYEDQGEPDLNASESDIPRILMQGTLTYGPNVDGALWLAEKVWPIVKERLSTAELRLAGKATSKVVQLSGQNGIVVLGFVEDMGAEVSQATIVVAPIRFGSGTRIKILEAFAHGKPVVSTSLGAMGLGVEGGRHLMIADTPREFAGAIIQLSENPEERRYLASEAYRHFNRSFRWADIREKIVLLAYEAINTA